MDWGSPFLFAQPDILRQSRFGLHFILAQTRPTAKCRLAQTLGLAITGALIPSVLQLPKHEFPQFGDVKSFEMTIHRVPPRSTVPPINAALQVTASTAQSPLPSAEHLETLRLRVAARSHGGPLGASHTSGAEDARWQLFLSPPTEEPMGGSMEDLALTNLSRAKAPKDFSTVSAFTDWIYRLYGIPKIGNKLLEGRNQFRAQSRGRSNSDAPTSWLEADSLRNAGAGLVRFPAQPNFAVQPDPVFDFIAPGQWESTSSES